MKTINYIPRFAWIIALTLLCAVSGVGASKKSRAFNAQLEEVWTAAAGVAKEAFLSDKSSRAEGTLRFRCGPLRGYRFEAVILHEGAGKTRVQLELKTNLRGIDKDAWRNGDRYLSLVAQRLQRGGGK